jgi:hypothetical protein
MTPQIIKEKGKEILRTCWSLFRRHHSTLSENTTVYSAEVAKYWTANIAYTIDWKMFTFNAYTSDFYCYMTLLRRCDKNGVIFQVV